MQCYNCAYVEKVGGKFALCKFTATSISLVLHHQCPGHHMCEENLFRVQSLIPGVKKYWEEYWEERK